MPRSKDDDVNPLTSSASGGGSSVSSVSSSSSSSTSMCGSMTRFLPKVLRNMCKEDVLAGLTVGVMVIPQGMAYAMLADLDPIYGLYSALVPPMAYAFMGDSRQLHVGPVSMVSLLTAAAIGRNHVTDPALRAACATLIALIAGWTQIAMGALKLGSLVSFATLPIISGFTAGASVVVIVAQSSKILGVKVKSASPNPSTWEKAADTVMTVYRQGCNIPSLGLGILFLLALWFMKHLSNKHPNIPALKAAGPLFVVVFGTVATQVFSLHKEGVDIIAKVPSGLPSLTSWHTVFGFLPEKSIVQTVLAVLDTGLAVAFISFMESIAVAKTLALHHGYEVDANKELVAIGASNVMGTLFRGYANAGAFSRSAVASGTGAKTQAAAVVSSVVVGVTLMFLTQFFFYLPSGVLAAIVIQAVWGLIKISDLNRLRQLSFRDTALWLVAFSGTLYSVSAGILTAVGLSLLFVVRDTVSPPVEMLGKVVHQGTATYIPMATNPDAIPDEKVLVLALSGVLHGAAAPSLKSSILAVGADERVRRGQGVPKPSVVFDMSAVSSMDTTCLAALDEVCGHITKAEGVGMPSSGAPRVAFVGLKSDVRKMMEVSRQLGTSGDPSKAVALLTFPTIPEAISKFSSRDDADWL